MTNREGAQMSRRVVFARAAVVTVGLGRPRRYPRLEPLEDVLPKSRLVIVYENGRRDVHGRNEDHAIGDRRRRTAGLDRVRDVNDFLPALGVEGEIGRMNL